MYFFHCKIDNIKKLLSEKSGLILSDSTEIDYVYNDVYEYNPKANGKPMSGAFFSINENLVVMFPNLCDGWNTLVNFTCSELKTDDFSLKLIDDSYNEPCNYFTCYKHGKAVRTVYSLKDGRKLTFYETGELLEFENPEYYLIKIKKSRINKSIMIEYLNNLKLIESDILTYKSENAFSVERS